MATSIFDASHLVLLTMRERINREREIVRGENKIESEIEIVCMRLCVCVCVCVCVCARV